MAYYTLDQNLGDGGNNLTYQKCIAMMMHGFGDNPNPNPATVALVESITMQQMHGIVAEAMKNMERRNSNKLTSEDVIFLMRHNKFKLKKLLNYYDTMETVTEKTKGLGEQLIPNVLLEDDDDATVTKRVRVIRKIITTLDETNEIKHIADIDPMKQERLLRIYKFADNMPLEKYIAFNKARSTSFLKSSKSLKQVAKFKQWLNLGSGVTVKADVLGLLNYLARDTLGALVDLAFIVRQDSKRNAWDPLSHLEGGNYCNPVSLVNSVYIKTGQEGVLPLTVNEIREAIRRFSSQQIGIRGLFFRDIKGTTNVKFLALE